MASGGFFWNESRLLYFGMTYSYTIYMYSQDSGKLSKMSLAENTVRGVFKKSA